MHCNDGNELANYEYTGMTPIKKPNKLEESVYHVKHPRRLPSHISNKSYTSKDNQFVSSNIMRQRLAALGWLGAILTTKN